MTPYLPPQCRVPVLDALRTFRDTWYVVLPSTVATDSPTPPQRLGFPTRPRTDPVPPWGFSPRRTRAGYDLVVVDTCTVSLGPPPDVHGSLPSPLSSVLSLTSPEQSFHLVPGLPSYDRPLLLSPPDRRPKPRVPSVVPTGTPGARRRSPASTSGKRGQPDSSVDGPRVDVASPPEVRDCRVPYSGAPPSS